MKKIFVPLVLIFSVIFMSSADLVNKNEAVFGMAKFQWKETTHDFGKIEQGTPVEYKFTFKNTGQIPLVISRVQASCGCTVTEYSKDPVAPGKEGFVKATYDAARTGTFNKSVRVTANIDGGSEMLRIKGEVVPQGEASTK